MRAAAGTLKRVSLELGGKSPNIVFADADVALAAKQAVLAAFYNQGELCTAGQSPARRARRPRSGARGRRARREGARPRRSARSDKTQMGPLVSREHLAKVSGYIARGEAEGAHREAGAPANGPGLLRRSDRLLRRSRRRWRSRAKRSSARCCRSFHSTDVEEAARLADATEYGLAAGVWTRDIGKAHALAARLRAGTVWINTYNRFDAASPYGGYKQVRLRPRERPRRPRRSHPAEERLGVARLSLMIVLQPSRMSSSPLLSCSELLAAVIAHLDLRRHRRVIVIPGVRVHRAMRLVGDLGEDLRLAAAARRVLHVDLVEVRASPRRGSG